MGIINAFSYKRLQSVLGRRDRKKGFINLYYALTVGVLWADGQEEALDLLLKSFQKFGITYETLCYGNKEDEASFVDSDFTIWGTAKTEDLSHFMARKFDVLIDISMVDNLTIKQVRALSMAKFKVGADISMPNYADFNIALQDDEESPFLAQQIVYYLSEINKPNF